MLQVGVSETSGSTEVYPTNILIRAVLLCNVFEVLMVIEVTIKEASQGTQPSIHTDSSNGFRRSYSIMDSH